MHISNRISSLSQVYVKSKNIMHHNETPKTNESLNLSFIICIRRVRCTYLTISLLQI
jgi:hypothetical protein